MVKTLALWSIVLGLGVPAIMNLLGGQGPLAGLLSSGNRPAA